MISSLKAKVKCAQLGLHYLGTGRGFETAIESIGFHWGSSGLSTVCPGARLKAIVRHGVQPT
jgi:hypothetical protein